MSITSVQLSDDTPEGWEFSIDRNKVVSLLEKLAADLKGDDNRLIVKEVTTTTETKQGDFTLKTISFTFAENIK